MGIISLIGAIVSGLVGAGIGISNTIRNKKNADSANAIHQQNFESQEYWNQKNYEQQQEVLDLNKANVEWEKQKYEQQIQREDTAVQRRTEDLKAAGINPILAAGQAATTAAPISPNQLEAAQRQSTKKGFTPQALTQFDITNLVDAYKSVKLLGVEERLRNAEADLIIAQKNKITAETTRTTTGTDLDLAYADIAKKQQEELLKQNEFNRTMSQHDMIITAQKYYDDIENTKIRKQELELKRQSENRMSNDWTDRHRLSELEQQERKLDLEWREKLGGRKYSELTQIEKDLLSAGYVYGTSEFYKALAKLYSLRAGIKAGR